MSQVVEFPTDILTTEYRDQIETGGFSDAPRRLMQFKHILPSLPNRIDRSVWYELQTALVLRQVAVRKDLQSVFHKMVLKGIGSSSDQAQRDPNLVSDTAEVAFDQIGLGSVQGAARAWINSFYGISDSIRQDIDLKKNGIDYGDTTVHTYVVDSIASLERNKFPCADIDRAKDISAIILSKIKTCISRNEMKRIARDATNVSWRFGRAPRVIIRADYPHSLFINRDTPTVTLHSALRSSENPLYMRSVLNIPIDPLERKIIHRDSMSVSSSAAPQP